MQIAITEYLLQICIHKYTVVIECKYSQRHKNCFWSLDLEGKQQLATITNMLKYSSIYLPLFYKSTNIPKFPKTGEDFSDTSSDTRQAQCE